MKKGFTLVELLACIVILGFIAVIAVPNIRNATRNIKMDLFKDNVNELLKIIREQQLKYGSLTNVTYNINNNDITPTLNYKKSFNGQGTIMIDADGNTYVEIKTAEFCAYKKYEESIVNVYKESCNAVKNTTFLVTNLITNGSFENDSNGWVLMSDAITVTSSLSKFGNYSVKNYHGQQFYATYSQDLINANEGHKYYYSAWLYTVSKGEGENIGGYLDYNLIYDSVEHWESDGMIQTNLEAWEKFSSIREVTTNTTKLRVALVNYNGTDQTQEVYGDGALLIDLTETFGSGREPSKEWCDSNLDYFDGSKVFRYADVYQS